MIVVFLRGVNVGGHRTFRPKILAEKLKAYDTVNIGAAGTFVIRKPISQPALRAELQNRLPFETEVMICTGKKLKELVARNPFKTEAVRADHVRFVSILSKRPRGLSPLPASFPSDGDWFVRIVAAEGPFVFGVYRRHMKTIRYLGMMDKLLGGPATTRNWNTITSVIRVLESIPDRPARQPRKRT